MAENFQHILENLLNTDDRIRGQAEVAFHEIRTNRPDTFMASIMQVLTTPGAPMEARLQCAVLLRKYVGSGKDSLWSKLNEQMKNELKSKMLQLLLLEKDADILVKVCNAVSVLILQVLRNGMMWPEVFQFLTKWAQSETPYCREMSLHMLSEFCQLMDDNTLQKITNSQPTFIEELKNIFIRGIQDSEAQVRGRALRGIATMFMISSDHREEYQQYSSHMIEAVSGLIHAKQEQASIAALTALIDIAEADCEFYRAHITPIWNSLLELAANRNIEEAVRHLCLEVVVTICEHKPGMMRRQGDFLPRIVPLLLEWVTNIEENENWNLGEQADVEDQEHEVACESIDRMALSLGGTGLVPVLFLLCPQMLQNESWKVRYGGLMAMSVAAEGCAEQLKPSLKELMQIIMPTFADPDPRVRWCACNTIGQFASDFQPEFQNEFAPSIMPYLIHTMDDHQNPRTQSHAAAAVVNLCETLEGEILIPHLNELFQRMATMLHNNKRIVLEQTITAVAAVADCVQREFTPYYDNFMPYLKNVLRSANGNEYRELRGRAMEAIGILACAVGEEKFAPDTNEVMSLITEIQNSELDSDDPQVLYLQRAWGYLAKALRQKFKNILPMIIPPLIRQASQEPEMKILDIYDQTYANDPDTWQVVPVHDKQIVINTAVMEDKKQACNSIFSFCQYLEGSFFPYVDEVSKIMVGLLSFYYDPNIRSIAVQALPLLLHSTRKHVEETGGDITHVHRLWFFMLPRFVQAIEKELEMEVLLMMGESFAECILKAGPCLDAMSLQNISRLVHQQVEQYVLRKNNLLKSQQDEDFDEEARNRMENVLSDLGELLARMAEIVGNLAKTHKDSFFPHFDKQKDIWTPFLSNDAMPFERQYALCALDDVLEHCGEGALQYYQSLLPIMIGYCSDSDMNVRQAAVYGVGLCAKVGGTSFAPVVQDALSRIVTMLQLPDARAKENGHSTDNAVAALGKLISFQSQHIDVAQVIPLFLDFLPLRFDVEEGLAVNKLLVMLLAEYSNLVLGENCSRLPKVLAILAEVLGTDKVDDETNANIGKILSKMQNEIPGNVLQDAFNQLPEQLKAKLQG